MKSKWASYLLVGVMLACTVPQAGATQDEPVAVVADAVLVRPACLAATVIGSAFFVVSLPFAALSKSTRSTARALVVKPFNATFTRPLGDLDSIGE
jgi:hypothetical protein